jgi:hypothetical protein
VDVDFHSFFCNLKILEDHCDVSFCVCICWCRNDIANWYGMIWYVDVDFYVFRVYLCFTFMFILMLMFKFISMFIFLFLSMLWCDVVWCDVVKYGVVWYVHLCSLYAVAAPA